MRERTRFSLSQRQQKTLSPPEPLPAGWLTQRGAIGKRKRGKAGVIGRNGRKKGRRTIKFKFYRSVSRMFKETSSLPKGCRPLCWEKRAKIDFHYGSNLAKIYIFLLFAKESNSWEDISFNQTQLTNSCRTWKALLIKFSVPWKVADVLFYAVIIQISRKTTQHKLF